jgi:hypothetical protein
MPDFNRKSYGKVRERLALRIRQVKQGQEVSACDIVIDIGCHPLGKSSLASYESETECTIDVLLNFTLVPP